jgi:hypothetical protein
MKKWLILFAIIDFIFVGVVLKISTSNQRNVATYNDPFYAELNEGQKNKYDFVKSFQFLANADQLVLTTDRLQSLCQSDSMVEVKFTAINVAYAGVHPSISHIYSCENVRKDVSNSSLITRMQDFMSMHKVRELKLEDSQMTASQVYPGEDFPTEWILSDLIVTGGMNFAITTVELDKVHTDHRFEFSLSTSSK